MFVTFVLEMAASRFEGSIVSSVFWKGLGGACNSLLAPSSSDVSDIVLPKGSSSRGMGVGGLSVESSSSTIVEGESNLDGDGGGGDCTRTFLAAFFGKWID